MKAKIVLLPGDGIGPEVVAVARELLEVIGAQFGHEFEMAEYDMGGCAIDATGNPLPENTLNACLDADAVLLGAVGGPKWDDPKAKTRPEIGLLGLRKAMGLYANIRPIQPHPELLEASPLRPEKLAGVDFVVIRELTGGLYFGEPKERRIEDGELVAIDTLSYKESEIERVAHLAFSLAQERKKKLTSVDKANVLESSRLWRETVTKMAEDYPEVTLEHILIDAATMHLLTRANQFDVILTTNMFGDILTDEASILTGSMGNLPSAALGTELNKHGFPRGLYEPIHGSAPDIAGKGIANPIGTILSTAMMLRHSLGLEDEAQALEAVINDVLEDGHRTSDLAKAGAPALSTQELQDILKEKLVQQISV